MRTKKLFLIVFLLISLNQTAFCAMAEVEIPHQAPAPTFEPIELMPTKSKIEASVPSTAPAIEPAAVTAPKISKPQPSFEFPTLTEWTARCLAAYDEKFDGSPCRGTSTLSSAEFTLALNLFLHKFKEKDIFKEWVLHDLPQTTASPDFKYPYITKLDAENGSIICFTGDLHGSLHSLLRNLWRLVALGYLDKNFKLTQKNFYLVFLGDYVDRGRYGAEVLYTLLRLKCANWGRVSLIRGNHEIQSMNNRAVGDGGGFGQELVTKYQEKADDIYKKIGDLYQRLPLAIYITVNEQTIKAVHAGFGPYEYYHDDHMKKLITTKTKRYRHVQLRETDLVTPGFQWCDIVQRIQPGLENQFVQDSNRVWQIDVNTLISLLMLSNLKALFRGHQHGKFGLKMLFDPKNYDSIINPQDDLDENSSHYHWTKVVQQTNPADLAQHNIDGFEIGKYVPLFTFSSAPEGVLELFDCFGLFFMNGPAAQWRLKVYEFPSPLIKFQKTIQEKQGNVLIYTTIRRQTSPQPLLSTTGIPDPIRAGFTVEPWMPEAAQLQELDQIVPVQ